MRKSNLIIFTLFPFAANISGATTIVVDSFTQGAFHLSLGGISQNYSTISSPFGSRRSSAISSREAVAGAVLTSTLNDLQGTLNFTVDGLSSNSARPLDLRLGYSQGGPFSILGYDAFEFDLSSVTGAGFLIIELGSGSANYGASTNRININNSGLVSVPFSALNFGTNGSISSFNALHFTFEAATEQFSMNLNEIRIVPEPSALLLAGLATASILFRRRRE